MGAAAPHAVPPFDADWLEARLAELVPTSVSLPARWVVGWSGGADSSALLRALIELRKRHGRAAFALRALHVDHQLQADSTAWARHCRRIARRHAVPISIVTVDARSQPGESPELAARDARLRAFESVVRRGECLLLGQHARDQLETLLLRLVRGSGMRGLAGMPACRPLGQGWLLRPLLDVAPEALRRYLVEHDEPWIEDPSNAELRFDRNFVRAELLPKLEARWPAAARTAARSARLLRASAEALESYGRRDLAAVADGEGVALPLLRRLSPTRRIGALRAWFDASDLAQPDEARLAQVMHALSRREDAQVEVRWSGTVLRRHEDRLLLTPGTAPSPIGAVTWQWAEAALTLPHGRLRLTPALHGDVDLDRLPRSLQVRVRTHGRAQEAGGASVDVKSVLRELRVAAWRRATLPFIHAEGDAQTEQGLLAIADLWVAPSIRASARTRQRGRFVWQGP